MLTQMPMQAFGELPEGLVPENSGQLARLGYRQAT